MNKYYFLGGVELTERGRENSEDTVTREAQEELGIRISKPKHLERFEDNTLSGNYILFDAFLITDYDGKAGNEEPENCDLVWAGLTEADTS